MVDPTSSPSDAGRSRLAIYRATDAPLLQDTDMMKYADGGPSAPDGSTGEAPDYGDRKYGAVVSVLFRQAGEGGLSLIHAWLKPGFIISRHSHNTDCLYYVVSGEAILGNQVLRAGDGFFVPASHPYAYSAGPEGAEVLDLPSPLPQERMEFPVARQARSPNNLAAVIEVRSKSTGSSQAAETFHSVVLVPNKRAGG